MRLAVLAALLLVGCTSPPPEPQVSPPAEPIPGTGPADPRWTSAPREEAIALLDPNGTASEPDPEGWRVRWTPGNLSALPGDTARVRVDVLPPRENATDAHFDVPQWARETDGRIHVPVPPTGASFELDVLLGPVAALGAYLRVNTSEECCAYGALEGPALGLLPGGKPAQAVARDDATGEARGLRAAAEAGRIRGAWTYATTRDFDCSERALVSGAPVLRERVLHVFVSAGSSDACTGPAEPRTPRVEFEAGPLAPGDAEVRVHVIESCFCALQPWRTERANVTVGAD